jgi:hypothetical protein
LNQRLDAAQLVPNEAANPSGDERDYMVISRRIPAAKGKWRMVSKEVEDAERKK